MFSVDTSRLMNSKNDEVSASKTRGRTNSYTEATKHRWRPGPYKSPVRVDLNEVGTFTRTQIVETRLVFNPVLTFSVVSQFTSEVVLTTMSQKL